MARKRMFSDNIVLTDAFVYELPPMAQLLYYNMGMRADDEGFVNCTRMIMRSITATEDDLKALIEHGYVMSFPSGIFAICHWRVNNNIAKDRFTPTFYMQERSMLDVNENGVYIIHVEKPQEDVAEAVDDCTQPDAHVDATCMQPDTDLDATCMQTGADMNTTCMQTDNGLHTDCVQTANGLHTQNSRGSGLGTDSDKGSDQEKKPPHPRKTKPRGSRNPARARASSNDGFTYGTLSPLDDEPPDVNPAEFETDIELTIPESLHAYILQNLHNVGSGCWVELRDIMDNGISAELVKKAVDITNANGSHHWAYTCSILNRWVCDNVRTFEEAEQSETRFKAAKKAKGSTVVPINSRLPNQPPELKPGESPYSNGNEWNEQYGAFIPT